MSVCVVGAMKVTLLAFLLKITDIVKGGELAHAILTLCWSYAVIIVCILWSRTGRNLSLRGSSSVPGWRAAAGDM